MGSVSSLFSKGSSEDSSQDYSSSSSDDDRESLEEEQFDENVMDGIPINSSSHGAFGAPANKPNINMRQVELIQNELDVYEFISLIYLLCDDASEALAEAKHVVKSKNTQFLAKWAQNNQITNPRWSDKLIEAVSTIQNYQILNKLGYKKSFLKVEYPHHSFTSVHINKFRKVLYFVCEKLDRNDFERLLRATRLDFGDKNIAFEAGQYDFLEMYLLQWEIAGYIKQSNVYNLYKVLKSLGFLDLCDDLKAELQVIEEIDNSRTVDMLQRETTKRRKFVFEKILDDDFKDLAILSDANSSLAQADTSFTHTNDENCDNIYNIDAENPGICLIINQKEFYQEPDATYKRLLCPDGALEARTGTEKDREKLINTFRSFRFNVIVEDNLTHLEMLEKIRATVKMIKNESSLFICILSHGEEGAVYGVNSCKVKIKDIKETMCKKNFKYLAGKPKILILQSCQGNRCQKILSPSCEIDEESNDEELATDGPRQSVKIADLFTFFATVPGYGAIRNKNSGTWFIQSLCDKIMKLGNRKHFEDICTEIVAEVSSKKWKQERGEFAMVPQKESTLTKSLYLPKIIQTV